MKCGSIFLSSNPTPASCSEWAWSKGHWSPRNSFYWFQWALDQTHYFLYSPTSVRDILQIHYKTIPGLRSLQSKHWLQSYSLAFTHRLASSSGNRFGTKALASSISITRNVPASTYCCEDKHCSLRITFFIVITVMTEDLAHSSICLTRMLLESQSNSFFSNLPSRFYTAAKSSQRNEQVWRINLLWDLVCATSLFFWEGSQNMEIIEEPSSIQTQMFKDIPPLDC